MKRIMLSLFVVFQYNAMAQSEILLYGAGPVPNAIEKSLPNKTDTLAGGALRVSRVITPTLTHFAPANSRPGAAAIVICPGGGYGRLAIDHEGFDVAKAFNAMGLHAFVLQYRLPNPKWQTDPTIAPLQDAQQAIAYVRNQAAAMGIHPSKVGIMGFSAGGHLASTAATHFAEAVAPGLSTTQVRPDAAILIYPVISFTDSLMHKGSRDNLLNKTITPDRVRLYSNELQVTAQTPPTFLVHAGDDKAVKVANSLAFYAALNALGIPAELHVYPRGGHGFGMKNPTTKDAWMDRLENWLNGLGWL